MSCNFPCLSSYQCEPTQILPGVVKSPFVEIEMENDSESKITVGNNSNQPNNKAVIKSFEVGMSKGAGGTVEIYDEEGGHFGLFMEKIAKTLSNTENDYKFKIDFGWIYKDCNNQTFTRKASDDGAKLTFVLKTIQSVYDNGRIKFILKFTDLTDQISDNRAEKNEGTDDQKITLKDAIKNILKNTHPKINSVKFLRKEGKGTSEWKFKNEPDGPKKSWHPEQQNAIAAIRKWLTGMLTDRDKGIVFGWNPENPTPELILWEDTSPGLHEDPGCCQSSIGTYIANGGPCSNVLSFNPSAEWAAAGSSGGTGGSAATGGSKKPEDVNKSKKEKAGIQRIPTVSPSFFDIMSPNEIPKILQEFDQAQVKASNWAGEIQIKGVNAELKIVGEPKFIFPIILNGSTVSIILLNPFYINGFGNNKTWLTNPVCNEVWSNRGWQVLGVNHQISEGSFVTTIKVYLPISNYSLEPGKPLGCDGPTYENSIPKE